MFPSRRKKDSKCINRKSMEESPTLKTEIYHLKVQMKKATIEEHLSVMEVKLTSRREKTMHLVLAGINYQVYGIDIDNFINKKI